MSQPRPRTIPEATVARLAVYLRVLTDLADGGRSTVSSGELASAAGVRSILNFAPVALTAPAGVDVRHVDLSVELQVLAFLGAQRAVPSVEGVSAGRMA